MGVITISENDFYKLGEKMFGPDKSKWKFKCPICGHVQSMESVERHYVSEHGRSKFEAVKKYIYVYYNCEGRTNPSHGCNYSTGGLFKLGKMFEVISEKQGEENKILTFRFSTEDVTIGQREGIGW